MGVGKGGPNFESEIDCKTARIFACSSTREQLNKSSETRLKTESETGFFSRACEARELRARKTLTSRFTDFFTDFEKKKPTVLQSRSEKTVELCFGKLLA